MRRDAGEVPWRSGLMFSTSKIVVHQNTAHIFEGRPPAKSATVFHLDYFDDLPAQQGHEWPEVVQHFPNDLQGVVRRCLGDMRAAEEGFRALFLYLGVGTVRELADCAYEKLHELRHAPRTGAGELLTFESRHM